MGDTDHDPTDHSRTTQPHAGIAMKETHVAGIDPAGRVASSG